MFGLKVFAAYATRRSLELKDCKFLADGSLLQGNMTAQEVLAHCSCNHVVMVLRECAVQAGLEDGDVIDMMVSQIGGSC